MLTDQGAYPIDGHMWFAIWAQNANGGRVYDNNNNWNYEVKLRCPKGQQIYLYKNC